ncbi:MAG: hypothetical protein HKO65_05485 [Gemmatimonadetes bacterium]|nr:hypothetical protein [Gemmatimonadota bacterium]NNM04536.1 hypothetical protein [Gemmatimonadota bacterium]
MEVMPIDLTSVIAVVMGISVVLIPVIGLTARFALKPVVEALSNVLQSRGMDESLQIVERRLALLETQMEGLEGSMKQIQDTSSFDAQLRSGQKPDEDRTSSP